jgi:hypothetical protein
MNDLKDSIERAVSFHLPGRTVISIHDRGEWVRRIIEVTLDTGERIYFKIDISHEGQGWLQGKPGECHEQDVAQILETHGLQVVPPVLVVDHSCKIIPYPFLIQAHVGGKRLADLIDQLSEAEIEKVYETVGSFYRSVHAIHSQRAGVWIGSSPHKPWGDPTGYLYQAEIVQGSGKLALQQGRITQPTYDRALAVWGDNLDYLRSAQPSLIHFSPFLWNIYLNSDQGVWVISKLMSVGDFMWWDRAYDIACLQYPPFGEMKPSWWQAFLRGYDNILEEKRILLYAVLQRLCAAMGTYMPPESMYDQAWVTRALSEIDGFLDVIESF